MAGEPDNDGWPREREPRSDTRVIAAIHGAEHAIARRLALSTREHGLDAAEALVLDMVRASDGCAPWEIRTRIGLHPSTLSSVLNRLEQDGRIERRQSPFDGRRFEIRLTPAGKLAADLAEFVIAGVEAEIAGYTSPTERHAAVALYEACVAIGRRDRGSSHWD
jgi:DNA-binding MarR family transcriptional regulator